MSNSHSCHIMIKPTGSICNLDCSYCFYLEKEKLYPERNQGWKMDLATLETFILQHINAQDVPEVIFAWQGGEPTLMGIEYFETAIELIQKYNTDNKRIIHTFQTNGLLIDENWCAFFKRNHFLIGLSIDGPEELHNTYRVNRSGKPTHHKVIEALNLLKKFQIEFNTLTVINNINVQYPRELYQYLKSIGSHNIQFIPLVERKAKQQNKDGLWLISPDHEIESNIEPWSVKPDQFGNFLNTVFAEWLMHDVGAVYIQIFEHLFAKWLGEPSPLCHFSEECGSSFAMESNGDIYACDHYVYSEHKLGNIHQGSIKEFNLSKQNNRFGLQKANLCSNCQQCQYKFLCHGGCPKHRFSPSSDQKDNLNYLCIGYKQFFKHSEPYMVAMAELVKRGLPASKIMELL